MHYTNTGQTYWTYTYTTLMQIQDLNTVPFTQNKLKADLNTGPALILW